MVLAMRLAEKCDNNNELLTLLAIGNFTDENGRGCYASRQTLADQVLISRETVKRCIPRLAAKGLITPGAPALVAHLRNDRKTEVWDLSGAKEPSAGTKRTGGHRDPSVVNDGSDDHLTGGQTITPRGVTVTPNPVIEEPPKEDPHLLPSQRIIRAAGLGLSDDEEKRFIDWINKDNRKGTPWWRTVARNGDLPGLLADWRASLTPAGTNHLAGLPPWCGYCGADSNGAARFNTRLRTIEIDGTTVPCSTCHPLAAGATGTPQTRTAGTHRPYRNPEDQSDYLKGIA